MLLCIGTMLGDVNTHRFINFIEAACIPPVSEAQSTWQELLVRTVWWPPHSFEATTAHHHAKEAQEVNTWT